MSWNMLSTFGGSLGWLVSPFEKTALDEIISFLKKNYNLHSSVETNLDRLKDSLVKVQRVVEAAEEQQIQDQKLNVWLLNLKEIAYQVDDLIDTFNYRKLQEKVEGKSSVEGAKDTVKRLLLPDDETEELKSLVERLERHASNVGNFNHLLSSQSQKHANISEQRTTSSCLPVEHSFVGRLEEKKDIINILLTTEQRDARDVRVLPVLPVLPILGIGGVGKTTLAQVVYNDEEVDKHFSLKMWVCVSENFDVARMTREILEHICKANYSGITSFNILQEDLKKKLRSEKFLLVLDDIWSENERELWEKFKTPLCYGMAGSMILLTSRLPEVAKLMGTMDPIELEGLPEGQYWSFFKEQSFRGANPEKHPRLVTIGKEIALKLKGSPLAAKTMGPLLNGKLDADHWESISRSRIWESDEGKGGIMAALRLSYLYLPPHLRQCFAYLSIFPKDWEFKRDDVIRMWMAQGMIDRGTKRIEDVGKDYFNELISKSFFQPHKYYEDTYTIHDLLHDLAESVSKDDCFRIDGYEFKTIPTTIRHLVVLNGKHLGKLKENTEVLEKLRTLILYGKFYGNPNDPDLQDVLIQLKKIRLLSLRRFDLTKCGDNLSSLIHLRYLDLSDSARKTVLEELPKLYHLQTLELSQWNPVPAGIANLINLRHFIGDGTRVPGIGKLTYLQKLSLFRVQRDPEFQIVQLKYLRELRGRLTINNLDCVDSKAEAKEAKLCEKEYLEELCLVWDNERNMKSDEVENGILEDLRPNPNLKWLTVDGYRGTMSPNWMVRNHPFTKLEKLEISSCRAWKELPPLGQLIWLKSLKIFGMNAVKQVGTGFHGKDGFPSLESLELSYFPHWEDWSADEKAILFPRLQFFRTIDCPKLKSIPPITTTLEKLEVANSLMAQSVFAGIFGSPTVQVLLDKTTPFFGKNYMLQSSVKSNLERLRNSLSNVQYVLEEAEKKRQIQHETLYHWLLDLKEIVYRADDLIDTFEIQHNVEATRLLLRDYETKELSSLVERLERHANLERLRYFTPLLSLERLERHANQIAKQSQEHADISLPVEHSFVGRLKEKKDINIVWATERPNPNLEWLKIYGYGGTQFSSWMVHSFTNLVSLRIYNCRALEKLPPLGQLQWLKYLKICGMDAVKEVGIEFHGKDGFQSLERLVLKGFPLWNKWSADENVILFPRLQFFQIKGCPRLKSIPTTLEELGFPKGLQQLTRLKMLDISDCEELWSIASFIKSLKGWLEELHISNIPKIESLDISDCKELRSIRMEGQCSLELHISGCPKITKINSNIGLKQLAQLKRLFISACEELSSLRLSSLEVLNISDCEELSSLPSLEGVWSLKELNILRCPKITSIIGLEQLTKLKTLEISGCKELSSVPDLEALLMLQLLLLKECPKITSITGLKQLTELKWIEIWSCKELSSVPGLEALLMLQQLVVGECPKITTITGLEQLTKLEMLEIRSCKELSSVPSLEAFLMLQELVVDECPKITDITGLEQLTKLERLEIRNCKELSSVPGLEALPMQTELVVDECPKLNSETGRW